MGRANRLDRADLPPSSRPWYTMESAPRDGSRIELWIPYTKGTEDVCADVGYWDAEAGAGHPRIPEKGCFRFDGDDGPFDIQPSAWRPLAHT